MELIEMMYRTNFIVMVLSNQKHKVVIWDDHERKNRTEISFNSVIKNVKLRKDMLIVILETKAFIFSFMALKLLEQVDTGFNQLGLCGLSTADQAISKTIVLPNPVKGNVKVISYGRFPKALTFLQWARRVAATISRRMTLISARSA